MATDKQKQILDKYKMDNSAFVPLSASFTKEYVQALDQQAIDAANERIKKYYVDLRYRMSSEEYLRLHLGDWKPPADTEYGNKL